MIDHVGSADLLLLCRVEMLHITQGWLKSQSETYHTLLNTVRDSDWSKDSSFFTWRCSSCTPNPEKKDSLDTFSIETLTWKCRISHVPRLRELASPAIKNHHAAIQAQLKIIQIGGNLSFPKRKDSIGDTSSDDDEIWNCVTASAQAARTEWNRTEIPIFPYDKTTWPILNPLQKRRYTCISCWLVIILSIIDHT